MRPDITPLEVTGKLSIEQSALEWTHIKRLNLSCLPNGQIDHLQQVLCTIWPSCCLRGFTPTRLWSIHQLHVLPTNAKWLVSFKDTIVIHTITITRMKHFTICLALVWSITESTVKSHGTPNLPPCFCLTSLSWAGSKESNLTKTQEKSSMNYANIFASDCYAH